MRRFLAALSSLFILFSLTGIVLWQSPQAWAAEDSIDSWQASYVIDERGTLVVSEEIVYRFATPQSRGIQRKLMIREPYDEEHDAIYEIKVLEVSSPDAPDQSLESTVGGGRERYLNIRIGDPDKTVGKATATYVIKYEVRGALRSFSGYDEFYWDALTDLDPRTSNIELRVKVPGGAVDVNCYVDRAGGNRPCGSKTIESDGVAVFTQSEKPAESLMTIATKIQPGLIADNQPHLEPKAAEQSGPYSEQPSAKQIGLVGGVTALLSTVFGWLFVRSRRDDRYEGVPPGTIPPDEAGAKISKSGRDTVIPVRFHPPDIPLGHAGFIQDSSLDPEDMSAVLVDLAVKGAIQLRMEKTRGTVNTVYIRPVDYSRAEYQYERRLMHDLFRGGKNFEVALSDRGDLYNAFEQMESTLATETAQLGLIKHKAYRLKRPRVNPLSFGIQAVALVAVVIYALRTLGEFAMSLLAPIVPWLVFFLIVGLAVWLIMRLTRKGTRTAKGRAYTDQIEGFREYISTAEADQLRFEEGEDIFSKYLPWAILFGEADRWTRVCRKLIAMGRMTPPDTYWYYGNEFDMSMFRWSLLSDTLRTASTPEPPPAPSSSSTGWGGGSSFSDGGGFAGGGGGGGGTSSW